MLTKEQFINDTDNLRDQFEDYLVDECWYSTFVAQESDDWREERIDNEYAIYMESFTNEERRNTLIEEREEASQQEDEANKTFVSTIASV